MASKETREPVFKRAPLTRRDFVKGLGLAALSLAPLTAGCDLLTDDFRDLMALAKGESMALADTNIKRAGRIPRIDAAPPKVISTATFGLG